MLGHYDLLEFPSIKGFTMTCEKQYGGFGKEPGAYPDVLHTYMSLVGMSLGGESSIASIDPAFGFSTTAVDHIKSLYNTK